MDTWRETSLSRRQASLEALYIYQVPIVDGNLPILGFDKREDLNFARGNEIITRRRQGHPPGGESRVAVREVRSGVLVPF